MTKIKAFIFLGDVFKISSNKPVHLFDDYKLKRPTPKQLDYIKKYVENYTEVVFLKINRFETKSIQDDKGGLTYHQLDKKDWNYWVVEHSRNQMDKNFPLVVELSRLELTVLFEGIKGPITRSGEHIYGIMGNQLASAIFFHDTESNFFLPKGNKSTIKEITIQDKKELRSIDRILKTFNSVKTEYAFIEKALDDFLKLKDISKRSPFKILGYFSILELLLTTFRPGSSDSSLNNQLQKKINLLNNQLDEKIDFTVYFRGSDTDTLELIIEKLYRYRNDIAHGNKSDFDKQLKILKDKKDTILSFLHLVVRQLLLKAIKEPQLIKDLKEC